MRKEYSQCLPMHVFAVLLCSAYRAFSCSLLFLRSPPFPTFCFIVLFIIYPVGSPLFFQYSVTGAGPGAGFFCQAGQVTSSYASNLFEFVLAFPAPTFLCTQPPCDEALTYGFNSYLLCQKWINPLINQSIKLKILSSVINLPSFLNCLPISYTLSIPPTTSI